MVGSTQQEQQVNCSLRRVKTMAYTCQQHRQPMLVIIIATTLAVVLSSRSTVVINAFTACSTAKRTTILKTLSTSTGSLPVRSNKFQQSLASANTDEGTTEQEAGATTDNVEVTADGSTDATDTVTEITATEEEVPPAEAPEDPEITAIKEEIAKMEQEIKSARRQLADINDRADDYTKTGYARKVAEMENMRRARSMLQSSNKYTATAAVLTEFLPALDALNSMKERYEANEFGKMYNALPDAVRSGFTSIGCTEYSIETNAIYDSNRMTVIDSEPSATVPKDCIIRTIVPGIELQGNTIRLAAVASSSGSGDAPTPATPEE